MPYGEFLYINKLEAEKPYNLVKEFHKRFNHPVENGQIMDEKLLKLRLRLINEECQELNEASERLLNAKECEDAIQAVDDMIDAIADLLYVTYGFCVTYGIPIDKVFKTVHAHNMMKLGPDGKPIYDEEGKVMKSSRYIPPSFRELAKQILGI